EAELGLRLDPRHPDHIKVRGRTGGVAEQRGLPGSGLPPQDQDRTQPPPHRSQGAVDIGTFTQAVQKHRIYPRGDPHDAPPPPRPLRRPTQPPTEGTSKPPPDKANPPPQAGPPPHPRPGAPTGAFPGAPRHPRPPL